jgi:hypothetical protein
MRPKPSGVSTISTREKPASFDIFSISANVYASPIFWLRRKRSDETGNKPHPTI